jgi:glycine/D-amino acid oxidase-like deaminating enzyme
MPTLLIIGGGLFGSQAAAYARSKGVEAVVFDSGLAQAASPAAAGLFKKEWFHNKLQACYTDGLCVLEKLYGIRSVDLRHDDGRVESFPWVPPTAILETAPLRQTVTAVGDGWLEADGKRHEGWVYVAAGIWCRQFVPGLDVQGRAGASFVFAGEQPGRIRKISPDRQAVAFVRDPGSTHFGDGTMTSEYTSDHEMQTLTHAASLGLTAAPIHRLFGIRPYTPGGPLFQRLSQRTWLATGGRKLGTIMGAAFAKRLIEEELKP